MRLARRASVMALTLLMLCAAVSAQTPTPTSDPRNTAPTVGTGGPVGGPTGLFTIYDGSTLRRGEYTFSIAYSNYDRDPGNVDITEVPVSFQIGLTNHLELFFNTDAYRGVKVNHPQNLSSFYLPNTAFYTARLQPNGVFAATALQSGAAIVLAPINNVGIGQQALFRPVGNQPFVQFPFVGGSAGNFQNGIPAVPGLGQVFTLGGPTGNNASGGAFDTAANFPGIGSIFGSILPGIVLEQRRIPANLTFNNLIVPQVFTLAPTYLPDAPFISRLYGESSFSTFSVGAKWRLTSRNSPFGFGFIPFYRFYGDKADDRSGFNQMQRGASPGGSIGDFGLVMFADGRLSRSVNVSANLGYILNSNPRSELLGDAVLLDRPNELIAGVGLDFPVTQHFQPIIEVKSVQYVGGRTPNAFQNNPVDFLAGIRVFPRRWMGFSAAYRAHMNQQGSRIFNDRRPDEFPRNFIRSEDAHGYTFQFWAGRRNEPPRYRINVKGTVKGRPDVVKLPYVGPPLNCPANMTCHTNSNGTETVTADVDVWVSPENQPEIVKEKLDESCLLYRWAVSGPGNVRITPTGPNTREATLDLSNAEPGKYEVKLWAYESGADTDKELINCEIKSFEITVERCPPPTPLPTPEPVIDCPPGRKFAMGESLTFTASVANYDYIQKLEPGAVLTYEWSVDYGRITTGQGTREITVDTKGVSQDIKATLKVGYAGRTNCPMGEASCSVEYIPPRLECEVVDKYGPLKYNDEKARLDNYVIALQAKPTYTGFIVAYRGRADENIGTERNIVTGDINQQYRLDRALDYLVNCRGLSRERFQIIDGGDRELSEVELFVCPTKQTLPPLEPDSGRTRSGSPGVYKPFPACPTTTAAQGSESKRTGAAKGRRRASRRRTGR